MVKKKKDDKWFTVELTCPKCGSKDCIMYSDEWGFMLHCMVYECHSCKYTINDRE